MSSAPEGLPFQDCRVRLLARRRELLSQPGGRPDDLLNIGPLPDDDQAVALHDQFVSLEMNRIIHSELKLIDAALRRLDVGEYGACQRCGGTISEKRLRAVPWACNCLKCEERISTIAADTTAGPARPEC